MKTITMNDHRIQLPAGFTFHKAIRKFAGGDYDSLHYSIAEIITFEEGRTNSEGEYLGPFNVCYDGGESFDVKTLREAKRLIDKIDIEVDIMLRKLDARCKKSARK